MMYIKVEFKFKLCNLINKENEYHLWICSFALAFNDLLKTHNLIFKLSDSKEFPDYSFYFFKIGLGFMKETVDLIESCMKSKSNVYLLRNTHFKEKYDEFRNMLDANPDYSFLKTAVEETRNKVFHYNDFHKRNDDKPLKRVLAELEKDNFRSSLTLSREDHFETSFNFAEEIQINQLSSILEKKSQVNDVEKNLNALSSMMVNVMVILRAIVFEFVTENKTNPNIYRIGYK